MEDTGTVVLCCWYMHGLGVVVCYVSWVSVCRLLCRNADTYIHINTHTSYTRTFTNTHTRTPHAGHAHAHNSYTYRARTHIGLAHTGYTFTLIYVYYARSSTPSTHVSHRATTTTDPHSVVSGASTIISSAAACLPAWGA